MKPGSGRGQTGPWPRAWPPTPSILLQGGETGSAIEKPPFPGLTPERRRRTGDLVPIRDTHRDPCGASISTTGHPREPL